MFLKYRKKPLIVKAIQWNGDIEYLRNAFNQLTEDEIRIWNYVQINEDKKTVLISNLKGETTVSVGDWIIVGGDGEVYSCEDSIFRDTYDDIFINKKIVVSELLNKHNDEISFYVTFLEKAFLMGDDRDTEIIDDAYLISDDNNTLFDINPDLKEPTKEIATILKKYGLSFENGEIFVYATKDELESKKEDFVKALTEINLLWTI